MISKGHRQKSLCPFLVCGSCVCIADMNELNAQCRIIMNGTFYETVAPGKL